MKLKWEKVTSVSNYYMLKLATPQPFFESFLLMLFWPLSSTSIHDVALELSDLKWYWLKWFWWYITYNPYKTFQLKQSILHWIPHAPHAQTQVHTSIIYETVLPRPASKLYASPPWCEESKPSSSSSALTRNNLSAFKLPKTIEHVNDTQPMIASAPIIWFPSCFPPPPMKAP